MFRTVARKFLPNPLDRILKRASQRKQSKVLIGWNRGLGDIALGLYAIVHRIREKIPNAHITFLGRADLTEGFSLLEGVDFLPAADWKRGQDYSVQKTLLKMGIDPNQFDLIIERPSPTDWVYWQRGQLIPKLKWDESRDALWQSFDLPDGFFYICIQVSAETNYGHWRNWPLFRWHELLKRLEILPNVKVLLVGVGFEPSLEYRNVIDLRGKTTFFQLMSILKNRIYAAVLPDSGILSMVYYLDAVFPIRVVSLWADPNHGVLKQRVFSPNPKLEHIPLIGERRDLSTVSSQEVLNAIFPLQPLVTCPNVSEVKPTLVRNMGVIVLAGGQGSRLGYKGPKGTFPLENKSLFQRLCEKVAPDIPIAVMTSPLNHADTISFFQKKDFFQREIHFFSQTVLPIQDAKRRSLSMDAPNGNGSVYASFVESGLFSVFEKRGGEYLSIVPIENILADPIDGSLFSFLQGSQAEVAIQCIEGHGLSMGSLATRFDRIEILEYMEQRDAWQGRYFYTGSMMMTMQFLKKMAKVELPIHWVWKKIGNRFAWKGEQFIFDALPFATKSVALCYPSKQAYAPLKNYEDLEKVLRFIK